MPGIEEKLVDYVLHTRYEDLPSEIIDIGKNLVRTILGTTIAGGVTEGCEVLANQIREWGGETRSHYFTPRW